MRAAAGVDGNALLQEVLIMAKKDNLPLTMDVDMEPSSSITYANEVVATIAGIAAAEVEGIAGMGNVVGGTILGKKPTATKGVRVEVGTEETSVDLYVTVEYGKPIQKAAHDVQENVRRCIESMTGLHVVKVDVHVQGVSFEKELAAINAGRKNAAIPGAKEPAPAPAPEVPVEVELTEEEVPEAEQEAQEE